MDHDALSAGHLSGGGGYRLEKGEDLQPLAQPRHDSGQYTGCSVLLRTAGKYPAFSDESAGSHCHCHYILCIKDVGSGRFQTMDVFEFPVSGRMVRDHRQHAVSVYVDLYADFSGSLSVYLSGIDMVPVF